MIAPIRLAALLALMMLPLLQARQARAETLRLAVTTSFHNSGLADILLPAISEDTGLDVQLLVVGTGQAIRLGESGDVDAVLVHSRAAEEAMVASGHASHRREIMYNDFVFIGPSDDPSGLSGTGSAIEAMRALARGRTAFISRGDDSGTHRKELALWHAAGLEPQRLGIYREAGAGMGAVLNIAAATGSYTLSDRASWLNFANKADLALLHAGDPVLFNQYAYLPVNPALHPNVRAGGAQALENWLTSERGQAMIGAYEIGGQTLFTPNATQ